MRLRELFAGVSIDGSVLRTDQLSTGAYYQSLSPGPPVVIPPSALQLTQQISGYANTKVPTPEPGPQSGYAQQHSSSDPDVLRSQLIQLAPALFELFDLLWRSYLALPLTTPDGGHPSAVTVQEALKHYDFVASDAHGVDNRRPGLRRARRAIARGWGETAADRLTHTNPQAVIENRKITPMKPSSAVGVELH